MRNNNNFSCSESKIRAGGDQKLGMASKRLVTVLVSVEMSWPIPRAHPQVDDFCAELSSKLLVKMRKAVDHPYVSNISCFAPASTHGYQQVLDI